MLTIFAPSGSALKKVEGVDLGALPANAVWVDMVNPTPEEDHAVEGLVQIAVPTREEMQEIEISSRLYVENGARYMTAILMCGADSDAPRTTPVTFILSDHRLVTVRYDMPKPFALVENKLARAATPGINGESVLLELLEAVVDRCADILERARDPIRPLTLVADACHAGERQRFFADGDAVADRLAVIEHVIEVVIIGIDHDRSRCFLAMIVDNSAAERLSDRAVDVTGLGQQFLVARFEGFGVGCLKLSCSLTSRQYQADGEKSQLGAQRHQFNPICLVQAGVALHSLWQERRSIRRSLIPDASSFRCRRPAARAWS